MLNSQCTNGRHRAISGAARSSSVTGYGASATATMRGRVRLVRLPVVTLGAGDLVLCAGTLPRGTTFRERVEAAAAGGFAGISIWGRDYWAARSDGLTDADMRALLNDYGLRVAVLDPAWWWLPGAAEIGRTIRPEDDAEEVFRYGEDDLFAIADAVGARSVNAVDVFGGDWSVDDAAEAFAALCDRAADHGILVHLE